MPIFKILVTPSEFNDLVKEHPELISRASIDGMVGGARIDTPPADDDWTPTDELMKRCYERFKRRFTL